MNDVAQDMLERTKPSVVVNSGLSPDARIGDLSVVEMLEECRLRARAQKDDAADGEIAREFALAVTLIENAITRFNNGTYRAAGTFAITDAERSRSL